MLSGSLSRIRSDDPAKRLKGAQELAAYREPAAIDALINAIGDTDIQVRRAAATSLGQSGGQKAVATLVAALWDRGSYIQYEASTALVKIGLIALPYLTSGLQSSSEDLRMITEQLYRQIGGDAALAAVQAALRGGVIAENLSDARDEDEGGGEVEEPDDDSETDDDGESESDEAELAVVSEIERLVATLDRREKSSARLAAKSLAESADPKWWEALAAADERWDPEIAKSTAVALAKLCRLGDIRAMGGNVACDVIDQLNDVPGEHAISVFRRALGHVDPSVRSKGLRALESRATPPAVDEERRLRALVDEDFDLIKKLGAGALPDLLMLQLRGTDRHNRSEAAEQLGKLKDGRAVTALIQALGDEEERVRGSAVIALALLGDLRAVEPITLRLRDRDDWVRTRAADALGDLGDERAIAPLSAAVRGLDKSIRRSAAAALAKFGTPATVAPLAEALRDLDVEVRRIAAGALADIASDEACKLLAAATTDDDDQVRAQAARGLGRGRSDGKEADSGAEPALIAQLRSPGRSARKAAAEALAARGWEPADDTQKALVLVAMENALGAEEFGEAAVDPLCIALNDGGHYYLSENAAHCLGRLLDPRAVPALCQAIRGSTDQTVRGAAAGALGRIRDRAALPTLVAALQIEAEDWVKPYIVGALAKIGGPAALESLKAAQSSVEGELAPEIGNAIHSIEAGVEPDRLVAALADDDSRAQLRAAILLAKRGDPRGPQWMDAATHSEDVMLREKAIDALRQIGGSTAIQSLISRVRGKGFDGPNDAVKALIEIGSEAIAPMIQSLTDMDHNARWTMLSGLARMGNPAMSALSSSVTSAPVDLKKLVCEVLGRMYDADDIPEMPTLPLIKLLADPDAAVRRSAAHGLSLLKWKPTNAAEKELLEQGGK